MFYVCSTRGTTNFDLVVKGQINSLDSLIKRVIRIYHLGPIGICTKFHTSPSSCCSDFGLDGKTDVAFARAMAWLLVPSSEGFQQQ